MKLLTAFAALTLIAAPSHALTNQDMQQAGKEFAEWYASQSQQPKSFITTDENIMGGKPKHLLTILSTNTVRNSIGTEKHVAIGIRCNYSGNGLEAVILTPTYNGRNNRVSTRWNQESPTSGRWSRATSGTAYFHSRPQSFLNELLSNNSLAFAWHPYNRSQAAAKWNLASEKSQLQKIRSLCAV